MSRKVLFKRTIVLPALYKSLEMLGEFVALASKEAGLGEPDLYKIQLAVDEACSNIIEHAYGGETDSQDITCTCKATQDSIIIELQDHGRAFDPEIIPLPNISASLNSRSTGGLGLYFMRQLMDEVVFKFSPGQNSENGAKTASGNLLILVKRKEAPA